MNRSTAKISVILQDLTPNGVCARPDPEWGMGREWGACRPHDFSYSEGVIHGQHSTLL